MVATQKRDRLASGNRVETRDHACRHLRDGGDPQPFGRRDGDDLAAQPGVSYRMEIRAIGQEGDGTPEPIANPGERGERIVDDGDHDRAVGSEEPCQLGELRRKRIRGGLALVREQPAHLGGERVGASVLDDDLGADERFECTRERRAVGARQLGERRCERTGAPLPTLDGGDERDRGRELRRQPGTCGERLRDRDGGVERALLEQVHVRSVTSRYHPSVQLGRSLGFKADGRSAAIATSDGIHIADVEGKHPPQFHACEKIIDVVGVGGDIWAATERPRLLKFNADGSLRGELPLWGTQGVLRPTAVGAAGALWSESPPAVVTDAGPTQVALPTEPDCVVPVTSTRWVVCRRERVQLRDPGTDRWQIALPGAGRVVDGAVLFEGRTVALAVASGDTLAQLAVLGLHDGALQHKIGLSGVDLVRFAAARGFALFRSEPTLVVLVDLRFGRVLKEHRVARPILDLAIDSAGQAYMLRFGDQHDDVELGSIRALLAEPSPTLLAVVRAVPDEPKPAEAPVDAPRMRDFHRGQRALGRAHFLSPRTDQAALAPEDAVAMLERYRELVGALTGRAIARAWDAGRLSLPEAEGSLPFKAEVAGLLGRATGRATQDLADAEAHVAEALRGAAEKERQLPAPPPLARISAEFGLSPVAQLVLLVIAAPALWGELARLYGILSNDEGRPLIDELLVSQVLSPHATAFEIAAELDRDAPLLRHGIVHASGARQRPFLSLACDPIALRLLRAADAESDLEHIQVFSQLRAYEDLLVPAAVKDDIAARIADTPPSDRGRVVVRGRSGAGRHAMLACLAQAAGRWLGVIDATPILRELRRRSDELRTALRRAHLLGLLPCVDGLETLPSDDAGARDLIREILDDHPGPLAVRLPVEAEPTLAPGYMSIDIPPLSMEQRTASWAVLLDEYGLFVRDPDELADRFRVGPAVISRACAQVAAARTEPAEELVDSSLALETAIRQHLDVKLRATATRVERLANWSRVILPPDIQESVLELIARIKHRRTVYDSWGMGEIITTARGVTALFQGGPGTGKTLVASAIANELGMDLYRVDLSRIMSKWIGETEQNLAKLFDAAEDGHAIVLFDEADSLFAKRTEVKSSVDRYANLEVNYLLQRLDSFEGIAILTTNFGTSIDNAFKRRLSFRLTFPFPDEEAREALWRSHLPAHLPKSGTFDLAELARKYRLSGGYIRNAALRAAFLAAEEHSLLTHDHLERAIKAEFRELGTIADTGVLE